MATSMFGADRHLDAGGQRIRVNVRPGTGVPLVVCNSMGAGLTVLDPLVQQLDPDIPVIRFDPPGVGGSPTSPVPYGLPYLAWVLGRVLGRLGLGEVDVLGWSWGGLLAQQFALQNPRRCRRLLLAATGTGLLMVPPEPQLLTRLLLRRAFSPSRVRSVTGELYGGAARTHGAEIPPDATTTGYLHQMLAGALWTSLFTLPAVRQQTLIVAGTDDPVVPVANARLMRALLPHARLHLHSGGHRDIVCNAAELAPVINAFLAEPQS